VKEASDYLNLSLKGVIRRCKSSSLYDSLYLMYKEDYDGGLRKIKKSKSNGEIQVLKIDDSNQILSTYNSISEAAKAENISRKKLSKYLNKNKINNYLYATICN
jgi:phage antirepressor YoqD-like protein